MQKGRIREVSLIVILTLIMSLLLTGFSISAEDTAPAESAAAGAQTVESVSAAASSEDGSVSSNSEGTSVPATSDSVNSLTSASSTGENSSAAVSSASVNSSASVSAVEGVNATAVETAIYLNGSSGDDTSDGLTADTAVKTFSRAKELAADLASQTDETITIYVTGTVSISGDITLSGIDAIVKRESGFSGYLFNVASGATATLSSITIDGNSEEAASVSASLISCYGTLNIEDGTVLQNNVLTVQGYFDSLGGAVYARGGAVNMTGGKITGNAANYGGGVFLIGGEMNMSGGVISDNRAVDSYSSAGKRYGGAGGGICIYDSNAVLNVSGSAEIINNTSEDMGGGISVGTGYASNYSQTLNMTGGTVSGNSAGSAGGGIYVQSGSSQGAVGIANISAGTISNNSMTGTGKGNSAFGGGGIYVNGAENNNTAVHGILNLSNALIKDNEAALQGGGYAACPISITRVYVDDGAAIYSNTASSANEIYILASNAFGTHSGDPYYNISSIMLGGTSYKWEYPDGTEVPFDKLEGTLSVSANESLSLNTDVTSDAHAEALATVFITGNTSATRGGGIGSNGVVNIGKGTNLLDISVDKVWMDDDSTGRPDSIQIELYRGVEGSDEDPVYVGYETMTPDDSGDWPSVTFSNLPTADSSGNEYVYSIKERSVDGYLTTVSGNQEEGFTITNTESTSVSVEKVWKGGTGKNAVIHLYADGEEVASCELTEENGWQYTFTDLPLMEDGNVIRYTISEDPVEGYVSSISGNQTDGFTVTNTKFTASVAKNSIIRTGDSSRTGLYVISLLVSAAAVFGALWAERKKVKDPDMRQQ